MQGSFNEFRLERDPMPTQGLIMPVGEGEAAANNVCCDCCGGDASYFKRMIIEHCHRTGYIRGSTCDSCNQYIASYESGTMRLEHPMWDYIERYLERAWMVNQHLGINDYPLRPK